MKILAPSLLMTLGILTAEQGGRKCTNPKGNDGESYTEGCMKKTCKEGVYRTSLDASICCYDKQPYLPNTSITATEDGCARAVIFCKQVDDVVTAVLQVENTCGEYSTKEQVQEIRHLLVKYLEQTDCDKDSLVSTSSTTTTSTHVTEGILVSGGYGENRMLKSVELFIPKTGKTCNYPDLPAGTYDHTMSMVGDHLVVCGGGSYDTSTKSCLHLSPPLYSAWTSYATTRKERFDHTAWVSPSGELLLLGGGQFGAWNAEILNDGTSPGKEIDLKKGTRGHCGIDAKESLIITGGYYTERNVTRYNLQGHVENLPEMTQGRYQHGCGSYLSEGSMILIVAGGATDSGEVFSSTERLAVGAAAWVTVNALPRALLNVASLTVGNLVYLTGGIDEEDVFRSEILVLDGEDWREVGHLQKPKAYHAATMIDTASFMEFCN